jgi:hypothetical protein
MFMAVVHQAWEAWIINQWMIEGTNPSVRKYGMNPLHFVVGSLFSMTA